MFKTIASFLFLCVSFPCLAGESTSPAPLKKFKISTCEWPPYNSEAGGKQDFLTTQVKELYKSQGYELEVVFLPWNRAIDAAKNDDEYVGYFPEYASPDIDPAFVSSPEIGVSILGLVERKEKPISWQTLDDLKPYTIGIVDGYINTPEFDAMAKSGAIKTEKVPEDIMNVEKVIEGRLDAAIIDEKVLQFLLQKPHLKDRAQLVQFNKKTMGYPKLYIFFNKKAAGIEAKKVLEEALKTNHIGKSKI